MKHDTLMFIMLQKFNKTNMSINNSESKTTNQQLVLTPSQEETLKQLKMFVQDKEHQVFILSGYAGTGKTTLMKSFIHWLQENKTDFSLLASTGRAAKILTDKTQVVAYTVHSCVYSFAGFNQNIDTVVEDIDKNQGVDKSGQLFFQFTACKITNNKTKVYIIDEASMISDQEEKCPTQAIFGSGKLLSDLLNFDDNGLFVFVGDVYQLSPINQPFSPALSASYIRQHHHRTSVHSNLHDIVRQESDNDIIHAANCIRSFVQNPPIMKWGKFPLKGYKNILLYDSQIHLIEQYIQKIKSHNFKIATLICANNKRCQQLTTLIRPALGFHSPKLMQGELLHVTQNNIITGLMNGDLIQVLSLGNRTRRANLTFLNVEVKELSSNRVFCIKIIEEILYSNKTNLTQEAQKELFIDFYRRMKDKNIKSNSEEFKHALANDEFLNALRTVYGYALTCHKAQGGEWEDVFVDIPRSIAYYPQRKTYQWLYTAITRTSKKLHIANDFYIV